MAKLLHDVTFKRMKPGEYQSARRHPKHSKSMYKIVKYSESHGKGWHVYCLGDDGEYVVWKPEKLAEYLNEYYNWDSQCFQSLTIAKRAVNTHLM